MINNKSDIEILYRLHEESYHSLSEPAKQPKQEGWHMQLSPYRKFMGSPRVKLPETRFGSWPSFKQIFENSFSPTSLDIYSLARLLKLSFGVTSQKNQNGFSYELRANPSSGNLHSIESYIIIINNSENDLKAGMYHYNVADNELEQRCVFRSSLNHISSTYLIIGLSYIVERQSWRYGNRGFRYSQLDLGHAMASLAYSSKSLGWESKIFDVSDLTIENVLGLSRDIDYSSEPHKEIPGALILLNNFGISEEAIITESELNLLFKDSVWYGSAIPIRKQQFSWSHSNKCIQATRRMKSIFKYSTKKVNTKYRVNSDCKKPFEDIVRFRRSAKSFRTDRFLDYKELLFLLERVINNRNIFPYTILPLNAFFDLIVFVNRVSGLKSGLYLALFKGTPKKSLQNELSSDFEWKQFDNNSFIDLYLLKAGGLSEDCSFINCFQDIAGDSCFTIMILIEFESLIKLFGATFYRNLLWEAGVCGHTLYLEAKSLELATTGIGAFYDTEINKLLNLKNKDYQVLYSLAVGESLIS